MKRVELNIPLRKKPLFSPLRMFALPCYSLWREWDKDFIIFSQFKRRVITECGEQLVELFKK
jgi:hypothetical protein